MRNITHPNHFFHIFRCDNSIKNKRLFIDTHRKTIQNARKNYQESVIAKISTQKLGSCDFWKIFNSVSNKGKSAIPPLFDGFNVVTSACDKSELLASTFAHNCSLPILNQHLPEFLSCCNTTLEDVWITPLKISKEIAQLDSSSASSPGPIPITVLKHGLLELSSILSKYLSVPLMLSFLLEMY